MNFFNLGTSADYDSRKVARYEDGPIVISTARVTDSEKPYETAVAHPDYNDGKIIIVETYDTKEQAQKGHDEWVTKMTADILPAELKDTSVAYIAKMCDEKETGDHAVGGAKWRTFKRKTPKIKRSTKKK